MPARAAARVEQAAKKGRTSTPDDHLHRSATPSSAHNGSSTPVPGNASAAEDADAPLNQKPTLLPLPTAIQPGKPLPTVEDAQPDDLPVSQYQSIQERYNSVATAPLFVFLSYVIRVAVTDIY